MSDPRSLTKLEVEKMRKVFAKHGGCIKYTAQECGYCINTVRRYCKATESTLGEVDPAEMAREKAKADALRREYASAVNETAFRTVLEKCIAQNVAPIPPQPTPKQRKAKSKGHVRHPLINFNDWHFEETVKPEGVLGLNRYDIDTSCRRLWRVVHAALDWKADVEAGGRIILPELTIALIGDLLTGTLHGLERHSGADNIVKAALMCGDLLALVVKDLAAAFGTINIVGVVGNHGRLPDDKKVPTKDPTRSWDFLAYEVARRRLDRYPNIRWYLPDAYGALFEVGGHQCYVAHGNFIPNNLGVVGYGVRRFTSSLASNLQAAGKPLKYAFFGHWHSSNSSEFAGVEAFICPSLIGTQEYSFLQGGSVNRPAQELFLFDRELGIVSRERLYGEGPGYTGAYKLAA